MTLIVGAIAALEVLLSLPHRAGVRGGDPYAVVYPRTYTSSVEKAYDGAISNERRKC